jgi:isopenicillin N synthase-like dioxygenase
VLPGFREFMQAQIDKRVVLSQQLARAFALSLDLPEAWFDPMHHFLGCTYVFNYYPPFRGARPPTQWSISPHSDYGSFTLLSQDALGGLQVRNAAGIWIDVPPVPGTFVVNIGDLFAIWTNDLYLPSLHRALNVADVARISAPFFVYPQGLTMVECLPSCQGPGNPPLYEPRTAEAHVTSLIDQSRRTGRPGLTTRTARRFTAAE